MTREDIHLQQHISNFLDVMYPDEWHHFSQRENRHEVHPDYWATTVPPDELVDRAATIDVCMEIISDEKSVVTRVMLAQWVAAELGGPCDLLTGIALRGGYKAT
jgi:hypothetical protein